MKFLVNLLILLPSQIASYFSWAGPLIMRLIVGYTFMKTGWGKLTNLAQVTENFVGWGIPFPKILTPFVSGVECFGGAMLILGLFTRIPAAMLAVVMLVAIRSAKWSDGGDDLFTRAATEKRFVILDLEAVWCHWCHVMEKTTYANPQVQELLASKYLPVRVDQDANPDLSSRYGDWGWPATIVFGPDGTEIAKIRGYIEPERMQSLLKAIIDDPSPGPSVGEAFEVKPSTSAFLDKARP